MSFLSDFEVAVTTTFTDVVTPISASVVYAFQPVFAAGFTIWILLIGFEVAWGKTDDGITYLLTKIGKVALTGIFALYGWGVFAEFADDLRQLFVAAVNATNGAAGCTNAAGAGSISCTLETNLLNPLADVWSALWDDVVTAMSGFGVTSLIDPSFFTSLVLIVGYLVVDAVLSLVVIVLAVITMVMYMVSYASFELLMALGPFFVMCWAFPVVQRFFESWTGAVMTSIFSMAFCAVLAVFSSAVLGLPTLVAETTGADLGSYALMTEIGSYAAFGLLLIYMYYKVFDLAASLGGGMNMGNNMLGAMRHISRDLMRTNNSGGRGPSANAMGQGGKPPAPSGGGRPGGAAGPGRSSFREALARNHTFTGMAATAGSRAAGAAAKGTYRAAKASMAEVARVSRYAYNRGVGAWRS